MEKLVVEQLATTMPADLRIWLAERKPMTGAEAGKLADDYCQARRHVRQGNQGGSDRGSSGSGEVRKCHWCGVEGHLRKNCPVKEEAVAAASPKGSFKGGERMVKCFNCRKFGHVSMHCPERASYFCGHSRGRSVARAGLVEGTAVSDILLDTGCTCTMVRRDLIPEENLLPGEAVTMCPRGHSVVPSSKGQD